jgi:hypothetical protein
MFRRSLAVFLTAVAIAAQADGPISNGVVPPEDTPFPIGTTDKVMKYAVEKVNAIVVFAWVVDTNCQVIPYSSSGWDAGNNILTNKLQMDQTIVVPQLRSILTEILADTDPKIDKSYGLIAFVDCFMETSDESTDSIFDTPSYVYIKPAVSNSTYVVPDLSWFSTTIARAIPFSITNLDWARVEISFPGSQYPFEIQDRRLDAVTDPISSDGFLYLPTDVITSSSTNGGAYRLKISTFSGTFQSYDGDGHLLPETPMRVTIGTNGVNVVIKVIGGDSGRGYYLQELDSLNNETNSGSVNFVSPLLPNLGKSFVRQATNSMMFFRTVTTDMSPY